ncbi:CopG family transcriptional regulator [Propionibacteriaceae bacterium Y1923]|uniref:CopG family transcriptional regulator n=1 Tax=Aestuariimicrobium sp. Y1814 TaxID=3418742 RepID=UPI003C1BDD0C
MTADREPETSAPDPDRKVQFNVYLPASLVREVKHAAVDADTSLSAFVATILTDYLNSQER